MKKFLSVLALLFVCIGLVGCNSSSTATPSDVEKKIEAKESFIVVVTSTTCSYCEEYKPIVKKFTDDIKDASLMEVVIDKLDNDEKNDFIVKYAISGTPTTLFFKDGELKTMVARVLSENELEEMYNEYVK
ncbi:thioredoxin-related protein [Bacilli bacterium PM5-9]|nr:thioredoxin-related protein [Bacilli bacterium PM5-9]